MLTQYLQRTQRYLAEDRQDIVNPQDLIDYINEARGQVAGDSEAIRAIGTVTASVSTASYNFSAINLGTASVTGINGAIHVRRISYSLPNGTAWVNPRSWEWFDYYHLTNPVTTLGAPSTWSQYGQGAAPPSSGPNFGGTFYIDPPPDQSYTLNVDCVCFPIILTTDSTVEALPYLWTDAVPFLAAYYALIQIQNYEHAAAMMAQYQEFMRRARQSANPSVLRPQYEQASDPVMINKLGVSRAGNPT
jgi:hypothetical protein